MDTQYLVFVGCIYSAFVKVYQDESQDFDYDTTLEEALCTLQLLMSLPLF